jgi:hypothetical protein
VLVAIIAERESRAAYVSPKQEISLKQDMMSTMPSMASMTASGRRAEICGLAVSQKLSRRLLTDPFRI